MAYLMHIGFDNSARFWKNVFYFEYKGVRFKLIQNNNREWCNVLLTIVKDSSNIELENKTYLTASEFLSALSWEISSLVKVWYMGKWGIGITEDSRLKQSKCRIYQFTKIPFFKHPAHCCISRIAEIDNEKQRDALILFREALSTNNDYLSFLFFWQIMEIGENDPIGWINKVYYNVNHGKIRIQKYDYDRIQNSGQKLGNYFKDDCRDAIAHIHKRKVGKTKVKIDNLNDNFRIMISTRVIKEFARFYIKDKLKVQKHMYLVRKKEKSFPMYVQEKHLIKHSYKKAYEDKYEQYILKKWPDILKNNTN